MYIVPFTVMFVCTILTVKKLIVKQTTDNQQLAQNAKRNRRISVMLLLMCLAYVILTLPNRLCFSVFPNEIIGHVYTDMVFLSSNTLMYTRNATNAFFLYASVHGFRRDLRGLMLKCCGKLEGRIVPQEMNGQELIGALPTLRDPDRSVITQMPIETRC
jgi:sorbitol-specific phosphotransferase system component IIC